MKTALIIAVFCVICHAVWAFGAETGNTVDMSKIAFIESSGCKNMIGDNGKALGCYQLHEGVVIDYNKAHKTAFKHSDVMNKAIGLRVADWYMNQKVPAMLKHYGKPDTVENRLTAYNMGINAVVKGNRANAYINKYKKQSTKGAATMNKKILKIIKKAVKDINIANDGEPLDGDETEEIAKVFLGELDYDNGNV